MVSLRTSYGAVSESRSAQLVAFFMSFFVVVFKAIHRRPFIFCSFHFPDREIAQNRFSSSCPAEREKWLRLGMTGDFGDLMEPRER